MWQFPVPVSITGTVDFSTTVLIRFAPPLGISTSMYSRIVISFSAKALSVEGTTCMMSLFSPVSSSAERRAFPIAMFEFMASEPPLRIMAFPDFMHSPDASEVTSGLDS